MKPTAKQLAADLAAAKTTIASLESRISSMQSAISDLTAMNESLLRRLDDVKTSEEEATDVPPAPAPEQPKYRKVMPVKPALPYAKAAAVRKLKAIRDYQAKQNTTSLPQNVTTAQIVALEAAAGEKLHA
jgi:chromosome segregation ATPase